MVPASGVLVYGRFVLTGASAPSGRMEHQAFGNIEFGQVYLPVSGIRSCSNQDAPEAAGMIGKAAYKGIPVFGKAVLTRKKPGKG